MKKQTASPAKEFSYADIPAIEALLNDTENVQMAAMTGDVDSEDAHRQYDGDWSNIVKEAQAAGKLPSDFVFTEGSLQYNPAKKLIRVSPVQ